MVSGPSMNDNIRPYVIISPCRNEADYIRRTLDSVVSQSIAPALWIIVDDGSTDETPSILSEYASRFSWIKIVRRIDRGRRRVGPGVIDAFYDGFEQIDIPYSYLCKLDVDLDLPLRYFERLIELMESEPRLGTVSGKAYYREKKTGKVVLEQIRDHVSLGMTKFYRRECFEQIGGFVREVMWDGIDCHRARLFGWIAGSVDEPELRFEHLRPMGSSEQNIYKGRRRHGYGQYFMGTSLIFMTAAALSRITSQPRIIGSVMMWWGYVEAMLRRKPRYNDSDFIRFLRRWQWLSLVKGTRRATEQVTEEQRYMWNPPAQWICPPHFKTAEHQVSNPIKDPTHE
jgi:poly-beta-1,6-N-acetyl-D-glucosamine synthase